MEIRDEIIYEDEALLVVRKPAGLAVESARVTEEDLYSLLKKRGGEVFIVHRLDQVVEGLVVFAKTRSAAASLSAQAADGRMEKVYTAGVKGTIPSEKGELTDYLLRDAKKREARVVAPDVKGAKKAVLRYQKIGEQRLLITLLTGRFHQIRVQLAHAGMPIAGDVRYGGEAVRDPAFQRGRIALSATELIFFHPVNGRRMCFRGKSSF